MLCATLWVVSNQAAHHLDDCSHAAARLAHHHAPRVVVLHLGRRVRPVANLRDIAEISPRSWARGYSTQVLNRLELPYP